MPENAQPAASTLEIDEECLVAETFIDRYLWALYERPPKVDAIKVHEQRKVKVKRKGKTVTVTRTFTRRVDEEFGWKDPKAAEKVGMTMMDYVIGGMDRKFKLKLFYTLYAAEQAGLAARHHQRVPRQLPPGDRKRPEGGNRPVLPRRQHAWRLRPRARGRHLSVKGRPGRNDGSPPKSSGSGSTRTARTMGSVGPISTGIHPTSRRPTARNMSPAAAAQRRKWRKRTARREGQESRVAKRRKSQQRKASRPAARCAGDGSKAKKDRVAKIAKAAKIAKNVEVREGEDHVAASSSALPAQAGRL